MIHIRQMIEIATGTGVQTRTSCQIPLVLTEEHLKVLRPT